MQIVKKQTQKSRGKHRYIKNNDTRGFTYEFSSYVDGSKQEADFQFDMVDFWATIPYPISDRVILQGGFLAGTCIGASVSGVDGAEDPDAEGELDFGLLLGGGVAITEQIGANIGYYIGLAEFDEMAKTINNDAILDVILVKDAISHLKQGFIDEHNRLIAQTAKELKDCDVLMLAQFSMANAWSAVSEQLDIPVLTAPDAAAKLMKQKILG